MPSGEKRRQPRGAAIRRGSRRGRGALGEQQRLQRRGPRPVRGALQPPPVAVPALEGDRPGQPFHAQGDDQQPPGASCSGQAGGRSHAPAVTMIRS